MRTPDIALGTLILEALDAFWLAECYPPTCRDLAHEVGCATSTVHYWLVRLTEEGIIEMCDGHPVPKWVRSRITQNLEVFE